MASSDFYSVSSLLTWTITAILAVLIVKFFLILTRRTSYAKLFDAIPGPYALPLLGNAWDLIVPNYEILPTLLKFVAPFPKNPIVRVWLGLKGYILVKDAKTAEEILSNYQYITKSNDYSLLYSWLGQGLITSDGAKWQTDRKFLTPAFHFRILDDFNVVFNEQADVLIKKLNEKVGKSPFDIFTDLALCSLDVICEATMGQCVNAQLESDSEYVKAVHGAGQVVVTRILLPWLQVPFIFNLTSLRRKQDQYLQTLHAFTRKVIRERREQLQKNNTSLESHEAEIFGQKKRRAFLDLLLLSSLEGRSLNDEEIREQVDTFMFAGHDTTATNLSWIMYLLGQHPDVQKKLQEEVDQIIGSKNTVSKEDLQQMKYMAAVIKETLRLYPSVPIIGRKIKSDITLEGYHIPANTSLFILAYCIHHDPDIYPDPEKFDPTRFLTENVQTRNPFAFIPFSAGPRNCIGQKFGMLEEKVILSKIIQNFNIVSYGSPANLKLLIDPILHSVGGISVSLEKRQ